MGISWIRDGTAGADAKNWSQHVNNPTNLNELLATVWNDNLSVEAVYMLVRRAATVITLIEFFAALVEFAANVQIDGDLEVQGNAKFDGTVEVDSLTANELVRTNGSKILGAQPGLTTSQVVIESLNITQDTIDYAPGTSSFTAIVAITNNTKTLDFTIGALTGDS